MTRFFQDHDFDFHFCWPDSILGNLHSLDLSMPQFDHFDFPDFPYLELPEFPDLPELAFPDLFYHHHHLEEFFEKHRIPSDSLEYYQPGNRPPPIKHGKSYREIEI
jgi:hypothetical protein